MPILRIDPHAHLYDTYPVDVWVAAAASNLGIGPDVTGVVVIVDREGQDSFGRLRIELGSARWTEARSTGTSHEVRVGQCRLGDRSFFVMRGVQYVSAERLEVLGLGVHRESPDGVPARDIIPRISQAGGIVCLPWSPGKWLGARGRSVRSLLVSDLRAALTFGDISIRPRCGPPSLLLREARRAGCVVLPGTDPLPRRGDADLVGSYGVQYEVDVTPNIETVYETVLDAIRNRFNELRFFGRPNGVFQAITRFISTL